MMKDDAFVLAATVDVCSMVHLVCLFTKTNLLAFLKVSVLTWFIVLSCASCLHA